MTAPFLLSPAYKDYLWGGTKLRDRYRKQSSTEIIAESWELSCHPAGESTVRTGPYAGSTLGEYLQQEPAAAGRRAAAFERFPLLIKLIDSKGCLSIQVHPDDAYAARVEAASGKTEMWYVLDCEEGASLYCGFCEPTDKETVRAAIADGTITELLQSVPVKPGDVFFIEAGTVHAIGAGITLAEIQQNSDTTYRVYDFGRRDKDGNLRELHIEKALDVMTTGPATLGAAAPVLQREGYTEQQLAACRYFAVEALQVDGAAALSVDEESFVSLLCTEGAGELCYPGGSLPLQKGDSVFVPAGFGAFTVQGHCALVRSHL